MIAFTHQGEEIWKTDLGIQFQTRVAERDIIALTHGIAQIAD